VFEIVVSKRKRMATDDRQRAAARQRNNWNVINGAQTLERDNWCRIIERMNEYVSVYVSKCVCQKLFHPLLVCASSDSTGCVEPLVELFGLHPTSKKTTFATALGPFLDDSDACSAGGTDGVVLREPITIAAVEVDRCTRDRREKRTVGAIQVVEVDQFQWDRRDKGASGTIQVGEVDQFQWDRSDARTVGTRQNGEVNQFNGDRSEKRTVGARQAGEVDQFTGDRREARAVGTKQVGEVDQFQWDRSEKKTVGTRQVGEVDQFNGDRSEKRTVVAI
jgi:hypothetical protein